MMDNQKIANFQPEEEPDYTPYLEQFNLIGDREDAIVLIHDALPQDQLDLIYNYLQEYKDDEGFRGGNDKRYEHVLKENPEVAALLKSYNDIVYSKIKEHYIDRFGVKVAYVPVNDCHFVKWTEGMSTGLHADCERPDGSPAFHANFYRLNISALFYVNDNYEGGEIVFPRFNKVVKPKAGDLILFPSNGPYRHQVNEVIGKQNRYTIPSWHTFDLPEIFHSQGNHDAGDSVILWYDEGEDFSNAQLF